MFKVPCLAGWIAALLLFSAGGPARAQDTGQIIRDAVALHDQGDFAGAIVLYEQILERQPENLMARYELGFSQQMSGDFTGCIATASYGLEQEAPWDDGFDHRPNLFMSLGSCYSSNGDIEDALSTFRTGLAEYPDDYWLNFNISITLVNESQTAAAIGHLKKALIADADMSSPYYVLGLSYLEAREQIPAIFAFLSFLTLENDTERSSLAAQQIFETAFASTEIDEDGERSVIFVSPEDTDEGDFMSLSLFLSMAASASFSGEEIKEPVAETLANLLQTFFVSTAVADKAAYDDTFVGQYLMPRVFEVISSGATNAFSWFIVYIAGVEGAEEWLQSNTEEVDKLVEVLYGPPDNETPE